MYLSFHHKSIKTISISLHKNFIDNELLNLIHKPDSIAIFLFLYLTSINTIFHSSINREILFTIKLYHNFISYHLIIIINKIFDKLLNHSFNKFKKKHFIIKYHHNFLILIMVIAITDMSLITFPLTTTKLILTI